MRFTTTKVAVKIFLTTLFLSLASLSSFAAIESYEFSNDTERDRYQHFIEDMRCPKCQNQNLANSDSPISADLRRVIYEQIRAGRSDTEITEFMVSRYGDFILYNPRVNSKTSALWLTPIVVLVIGIFVIVMVLRHRRKLSATSSSLSASENTELSEILEANPPVSVAVASAKSAVSKATPKEKPAAKKSVEKKVATKATVEKVEKPAASKKPAVTKKVADTKKLEKPKTETTKAKSAVAKNATAKKEPASTKKVAKPAAKTVATNTTKAAPKPAAKATAGKAATKAAPKKA